MASKWNRPDPRNWSLPPIPLRNPASAPWCAEATRTNMKVSPTPSTGWPMRTDSSRPVPTFQSPPSLKRRHFVWIFCLSFFFYTKKRLCTLLHSSPVSAQIQFFRHLFCTQWSYTESWIFIHFYSFLFVWPWTKWDDFKNDFDGCWVFCKRVNGCRTRYRSIGHSSCVGCCAFLCLNGRFNRRVCFLRWRAFIAPNHWRSPPALQRKIRNHSNGLSASFEIFTIYRHRNGGCVV